MAQHGVDAPVRFDSYGIPPRSLNPQQIWAHILKKDQNAAQASQESTTLSGPSTSSASGTNVFNIPTAPTDKAATSMRILLHDTQLNFERFSNRVDTLINHIAQAKHEIHTANDLAQRGQDKFSNEICESARRTRMDIQGALGSPAQVEKLDVLAKDMNSWFQSMEKRLDAMHLLNQALVQSIQTQLQAMQTIQEQQGTILTSLMPLQPLLQAIPLHIDGAKNGITEAISKVAITALPGQTENIPVAKVDKALQFDGLNDTQAMPSPRTIQCTPLIGTSKKRRIENTELGRSPVLQPLNRVPSAHPSPVSIKAKPPTTVDRLPSTTPTLPLSRVPSQASTPRRPLTDMPIPFFSRDHASSLRDGKGFPRTPKATARLAAGTIAEAPARTPRRATTIFHAKPQSTVARTSTRLNPTTPIRSVGQENGKFAATSQGTPHLLLTSDGERTRDAIFSPTATATGQLFQGSNFASVKRKRDRPSPPRDGRRFISLIDSDDDDDE